MERGGREEREGGTEKLVFTEIPQIVYMEKSYCNKPPLLTSLSPTCYHGEHFSTSLGTQLHVHAYTDVYDTYKS